jgi:hypothetical protein
MSRTCFSIADRLAGSSPMSAAQLLSSRSNARQTIGSEAPYRRIIPQKYGEILPESPTRHQHHAAVPGVSSDVVAKRTDGHSTKDHREMINGLNCAIRAVPMDFGLINYRAAISQALDLGFRGAFLCEHYGSDAITVIGKNRAYIQDILGALID